MRSILAALGLGLVLALPAHAIRKPDLSSFRVASSPRSASIGPNQAGVAGTAAPVGSIPAGHVGSQVGNSGWYVGTAPAGSGTGPTLLMGHAGDVFVAGTKYPFQAGYTVDKLAILAGIASAFSPVGGAAILGATALVQWINSHDGIRVNDQGQFIQDDPYWGYEFRSGGLSWHSRPDSACQEYLSAEQAKGVMHPSLVVDGVDMVNNRCVIRWSKGGSFFDYMSFVKRQVLDPTQPLPKSLDDIAPYLTKDPSPNIIPEILDRGGDIPLSSSPTITGPSQIKGPVTTTTNPDGSVTRRQTTTNFSTDGNRVTQTSTVTNTETCTGDGSCSTVTSTTAPDPAAQDDQQQDDAAVDTPLPSVPKLYERKYPDGIVGIWNAKSQQLKETQLASFVSTLMPTGFVAGSCPSWTFDLNIAQWADMGVHVIEPPCWLWGVAKTLVIISALMLARSLIFGG